MGSNRPDTSFPPRRSRRIRALKAGWPTSSTRAPGEARPRCATTADMRIGDCSRNHLRLCQACQPARRGKHGERSRALLRRERRACEVENVARRRSDRHQRHGIGRRCGELRNRKIRSPSIGIERCDDGGNAGRAGSRREGDSITLTDGNVRRELQPTDRG